MASVYRKLDHSYYTGNVLAVDMFHLQTNELLDAEGDADAKKKVLRRDYNILSTGCGNLRHLIYTIASVPEEFEGNLKVTLNDIDPFIQARNVLFIFMMMHYSMDADNDIASKITTIWYSLHLPDDTYELLKESLTMLCTFNGPMLKIMTQGKVDITNAEYDILREVWHGWIKVDEQQKSGRSKSLNKQRDELLFGIDLTATQGFLTSFTAQIPAQHGKSIESWAYNGDFLASGKTAQFGHLNPTLTGKEARIFPENETPAEGLHKSLQSPSEVEFVFCVPLNLMPFADWDYRQASGFADDDSLLVMYHAYVTNQIKQLMKFAVDGGRLAIRIDVGSCEEITESRMNGDKYDRIFTSNLADYIGTKILLDVMKPLLNTDNENAVIVTQYWNWYHFFPLSKVDHPVYRLNGLSGEWIKYASCDTNTFLPFTPSQHFYQEYFNNTPYFIDYLRTDLKACRYLEDTDDLSDDKIPSFHQVKNCSEGLRMRDFRQDLNKVAPWRYRCNVRAVNMLPGYSRMLEWYNHDSSS